MMGYLALLMGYGLVFWLLVQDFKFRSIGSKVLIIPALWVFIQSTHPITYWLNPKDGGGETIVDLALTLAMMVGAIVVLRKRGMKWGRFPKRNTALILIYLYFAASAAWSDMPVVSLKRIIKDFGMVPVILVFLSEPKPADTIRIVFVRLSYILFPLSIIAIKWFPHIGRIARNSGDSMFRGLATHKNSLGLMVFIFSLMVLWDLFEISKQRPKSKQQRTQIIIRWVIFLMGLWLLNTCESKTSLLCLILGSVMFWVGGKVVQMRWGKQILIGGLAGAVLLLTADKTLGVTDAIIRALGKDPSLTGRTEIWQYVREQKTDPWIGVGFYIFWDTPKGHTVVEEFMQIKSTHNGYLEMYVDGGICADALLILLLVTMLRRSINRLFSGDPMGRVGLAFWVIAVVYNFSESSFFRPDPMWFALLLTGIEYPPMSSRRRSAPKALQPAGAPFKACSWACFLQAMCPNPWRYLTVRKPRIAKISFAKWLQGVGFATRWPELVRPHNCTVAS